MLARTTQTLGSCLARRGAARGLASGSSGGVGGTPSADDAPPASAPIDAPASKSKSQLLHALSDLDDDAIATMVFKGKLPAYRLEQELKAAVQRGADPDCTRAVRIRRKWVSMLAASTEEEEAAKQQHGGGGAAVWPTTTSSSAAEGDSSGDNAAAAAAREAGEEVAKTNPRTLADLPFDSFDHDGFYQQILGNNCELVVGFVPLPVGLVGPLQLDGAKVQVPMATTEGALVASTNRGCRAIMQSGGSTSTIFNDGMTRAPAIRMPSAAEAVALKLWLDEPANFGAIKAAFESTSNYAKLDSIKCSIGGRNIFTRFKCRTGDAMGMNMISKAVLHCMEVMKEAHPGIDVLAISGNVCMDKKPSAINWIEGRGKSVVCEVVLSGHVIVETLKCTVQSLVELNAAKNLVGSSLAGSIGGNNAHAANIVAAVFLATGQDPAQVVESATCMTLMEPVNEGKDLHVSVTMPSIEVGTIGGGTALPAQYACLELLGVNGAHAEEPGANAKQLARIVAGTVLAGEISLMSALASNHLVSAHLALNRKKE
jgi:hydroxymethylglutaryl-CoA reductase (NADPH)